MTCSAVLPIRLGHKTSEPINNELFVFYASVVRQFSPDCDLTRADVPQTIPIPLEPERTLALAAISQLLLDRNPDIVIIDLANSMRPMLPAYGVLRAIVEACLQVSTDHTDRRYVFLLPSQLWGSDPASTVVRPLMDRGVAWIVSDDGNITGQKAIADAFDSGAYRANLALARVSPLTLLKQKIVRQHGHFKRQRDGMPDRCVLYFYDGRYCSSELTQLIFNRIASRGNIEQQILVHSPESQWLSGAAIAAGKRLELSVHQLFLDDDGLGIEGPLSNTPLLVLPMCDTGKTCSALLKMLRAINPRCQPSILSILSTDGVDDQEGRRIVEADGVRYEVEYLLKVDQPHFDSDSCRQCQTDVPLSSPEQQVTEGNYEIGTFPMWSMILEAGLKAEADVPDHVRPSLGLIPNFPAIVSKNGPYLATQLHKALTRMRGKLPRTPIVVCPDEEGARALADALTGIFLYEVIRIPRDALKTPSGPFMAEDQGKEWFIQLNSLQNRNERTELIVLDEFNASGTTRLALKKMLKAFGLGVRCYVSLFDFNPPLGDAMDATVYSLYSINWLEGERSAFDAYVAS